jgi:tetratricopeptide (TPR) repeat protein
MSEAFDLHRDRGWEFYDSGKFEEAIAEWRTALHLNPHNANLYEWLGHCLKVGADKVQDKDGWEAAAAAFQQAINIDPASSYAHHSLGALNWQLGKKQEAISALKAAVVADPNNLEAWVQIGTGQVRKGDFRGAIQTSYAVSRLAETEEVKHFLAENDSFIKRVEFSLLIGAGLAATLVGVLIWNRRCCVNQEPCPKGHGYWARTPTTPTSWD